MIHLQRKVTICKTELKLGKQNMSISTILVLVVDYYYSCPVHTSKFGINRKPIPRKQGSEIKICNCMLKNKIHYCRLLLVMAAFYFTSPYSPVTIILVYCCVTCVSLAKK
jgi:hypothetical protein